MENIKSFLESRINKTNVDDYIVHNDKNKTATNYYEYVVCISDTIFNGNHQYSVENYWGPLRTDNASTSENNKIKGILGKHKCDKNTTCEVKIMDGEDLIHLFLKYNDDNDISERDLQDQRSKYSLESFIKKIK